MGEGVAVGAGGVWGAREEVGVGDDNGVNARGCPPLEQPKVSRAVATAAPSSRGRWQRAVMGFTVASAAVQRQQSDGTTDSLRDEVSRLVVAVSTWTPARWGAASAIRDGSSRADAAFVLAVALADLGERAGVGGPPGQLPPRLHDLALASQLAVLAAELLAIDPDVDVVAEARAAVRVATIALGLT